MPNSIHNLGLGIVWRRLLLAAGMVTGSLALSPTPAYACIYWLPDLFAPMPGCKVHDNGGAKGYIVGTGLSVEKAVGFVRRAQEVKKEVQAWNDALDQAQAFRGRLERFIGTIGISVNPLHAFAAEYNRQNSWMTLRYWLVEGQLTQDSIARMLDRARKRVRNPMAFDSIFARNAAEMAITLDQNSARETVLKAARAHFQRRAVVDSVSDSLATYGRELIGAVADRTDESAQAEAELVNLAARLNEVKAQKLSTSSQASQMRLDAVRTLQQARQDVREARRPSMGLRVLTSW